MRWSSVLKNESTMTQMHHKEARCARASFRSYYIIDSIGTAFACKLDLDHLTLVVVANATAFFKTD